MMRRCVLALIAAVYFFLGPGIEPAAAGGQQEPVQAPLEESTGAVEAPPYCEPAELDPAAGNHDDRLVLFSVVASGAMGDRREPGVEMVSDEAGWGRLRERGLLEAGLDTPDFSKSAVLVVHAGRRPTAGYSVTVTRVRLLPESAGACGRELVVKAVVEGPPEGSMAATVVTAPYAVIMLPVDVALREKLTIELKLL